MALLSVVAGPVAVVAEEVTKAVAEERGAEGGLAMKTEPVIARIQRVVLVRLIPHSVAMSVKATRVGSRWPWDCVVEVAVVEE